MQLELPGRDVPDHDPGADLGQLEREAAWAGPGLEHAVTAPYELAQEAAVHLEPDPVHRPRIEPHPLALAVVVEVARDVPGVVRDPAHRGMMASCSAAAAASPR